MPDKQQKHLKTKSDRFLWLIDELIIRKEIKSGKELKDRAGISPSNITNIRAARNGLGPTDTERLLNAFPSINRAWLIDGRGEPFTIKTNESAELRKLLAKYGLKSLADQIKELQELLEDGVITKAEFIQGKRKILR